MAKLGEPSSLLSALGDWILNNLQGERDRWPLWCPVGFGLGIACYFAWSHEPPAGLGPLFLLGAVALIVPIRRRQGPLIVLIGLALVAAGFSVAQLRTVTRAAPILAKRIGPTSVSGQLLAVEVREGTPRVLLHKVAIPALDHGATPERVRLRLTSGNPEGFVPGDWIRARAILRPPPQPAMPGAYDFARAAYFQRLGAVGFTLGGVAGLPDDPAAPSSWLEPWQSAWNLWWSRMRVAVAKRILAALPGDSGALAAALMTGDRSALSGDLVEAMRGSGLAHLLAISGLHMGLISGLLFAGIRAGLALVPPVALRWPIKKWAALAAIFGAFGYLMLSGASVPTQRAFLMVTLAFVAVMIDRTAISLRLVAWAALAVLAIAPEVLLSASFQMSFAAVTALVAGYEALRGRAWPALLERGLAVRLLAYAGGLAMTSLIAVLATAPFAAFHFNRLTLIGLLANLVAVPVTGFWIMPWAILTFLLLPLGWEQLALWPMAWGLEAVIAVARWGAGVTWAQITVPAMPVWSLALLVMGALWLCLWQRTWRLLGLLPILIGPLGLSLVEPPDLLIGGNARLQAIHRPDGRMWLSTKRAERFTADVWRRRAGLDATGTEAWPTLFPAIGGRLTCDSLGCLYRDQGTIVALVKDGRALAEDCRVASLLISLEPLRRFPCESPERTIDRFDLWREGAHAIWLLEQGFEVRSVLDLQGLRPWSPAHARKARRP